MKNQEGKHIALFERLSIAMPEEKEFISNEIRNFMTSSQYYILDAITDRSIRKALYNNSYSSLSKLSSFIEGELEKDEDIDYLFGMSFAENIAMVKKDERMLLREVFSPKMCSFIGWKFLE